MVYIQCSTKLIKRNFELNDYKNIDLQGGCNICEI